jgi:hypothetical protein
MINDRDGMINDLLRDIERYLAGRIVTNNSAEELYWAKSIISNIDGIIAIRESRIDPYREPKDTIVGYFNHDNVLDTAWTVPPCDREDWEDCDECVTYICFSDPNIPSIGIKCSIGARILANEGDLNENGTDEIGFVTNWETSDWHPYHVWTLSNGKWIDAVEPISVHHFFQIYEENRWPIKKDPKRKGFAIITQTDFSHDEEGNWLGFVLKSKSVKVKR